MSMADQYDDGRYDPGLSGRDIYPPTPYGIPMVADEHGFAHTSIGYVPVTARRGGIKYPTPTKQKEAPMAKTLEQQLIDLKRQHKATHENLGYLAERIAELDKKVKARRTAAPPRGQRAWRMLVQFAPGGKSYEFLILRVGARMWTTGTGDSASFPGWASFMDWVDTLHWHGAMIPLEANFDLPDALPSMDA